jgi:two-component system OmpR family sensor kinase
MLTGDKQNQYAVLDHAAAGSGVTMLGPGGLRSRWRRKRSCGGRLAFESAMVVTAVLVLMLWAGSLPALLWAAPPSVQLVLALLAAAVGAAAVGLGETAGRLAGNRRAAWLIPALALYSVVVLPGTAIEAGRADASTPHVSIIVAYLFMVGLLLAAVRPPARASTRAGWLVAGVAVVLAVVVREMGIAFPVLPVLASPVPVNLVALVGWCIVSTAVVVAGWRAASPPLWRIGLGFGVIALAHLYRAARPDASSEPSLVFSALRLLGVVVVLLGLAQLLRRALRTVLTERFTQQEELRLVSIQAGSLAGLLAELDHELRNALAGLSGITKLLDGEAPEERHRRARSAVVAELGRMTELLERRGQVPAASVYHAGQIIDELVALWRVAGMRLEASVGPGLLVAGRSSTLAQVLTNLLANCSRHAPGAQVHVIAKNAGDVVRLLVRDDGPGVPAGGTGRSATTGQGLGLQISARLVRDEGGRLRVHPPQSGRRGFTVSVELPAVPSPRPMPSAPGQAQTLPALAQGCTN